MTDEKEHERIRAQEYIKCFLCGSEVKLSMTTHGCCIPCFNREHD
jgi:hypothetical protein